VLLWCGGDVLRAAQVYYRLKTPLLTFISAATPEIAFTVLSHIELIVQRCPGVFDDEYKQFFCRYEGACALPHKL
jgi:hypothetical protein